ncbi:nadh dehydrogenase [Venturia nashicola]|uniref:Nadh dehydrogenase n=1 Tax=Venturia nashicola TaxID=86259 RepID=A0A4Z1P1J6_9PEZI|nr:nadh dehydrogenase [Venturia nashicola]
MSAYRINRSLASFVLRPSTNRGSGNTLERFDAKGRHFSVQRQLSAEIREPERSGLSHITATPSPDVHVYSQRREISTSHLDRKQDGRERVVILGSGWAGYSLCKDLDSKKYQVIMVSPRSYFVFTPLLASTSVGTLEFRTAMEPIRNRRNKASFVQGWAENVDLFNKTITIEEAVADPVQGRALTTSRDDGKDEEQLRTDISAKSRSGQRFDLSYDKLIIGVGCYNQTYNIPGVKEHANFLKDVGDARSIRKRLLECFETAALPTTPNNVRESILNFAVVGGGPTGIEFSAELHDLIHQDMAKMYPELIKFTKITIYDVGDKVLSQFDNRLSDFAMGHFSRSGIDIKTSRRIQSLEPGLPDIEPDLMSGRLGYTLKVAGEADRGVGMCIWSTGLMMNPFIQKALTAIRQFPPDEVIFKDKVEDALQLQWHIKQNPRTGAIVTNDRLRVLITPDGAHGEMKAHLRDVFAIGDCSSIENQNHPATAQVASQKARWLARALNKDDLHGDNRFVFKNLGIMAYLGNMRAIFEGGNGMGNVSGRAAWVLWRGAYLAKSISWRNRLLIPMYWFLNWAFGRDISRF